MLFCTRQFLFFFLIVFAAYWSLGGLFADRTRLRQARVWLLLIASFFFYGTYSVQLACLVTLTTVLDFLFALRLDASQSPRARKLLLIVGVTFNLGILCLFKYCNFFLDTLKATLTAAGHPTASFYPALDILVPFGISFYTFEAISYLVDVYRRRIPAERNLSHFMLFILFFPHLVAGPIVRGGDFLPQIKRPKRWNWVRAQVGVQLILMGLFKKWAIADHLALFCDPVLQSPGDYNASAAWLAVIAFALRIYGDFSGYSDIALGTAHLLGYKLALNFNMPYLSANVQEFWRRWHISLSSWLRDYLFIGLGGSRCSEWKTCRNLLITMTLGGLWHGASWKFVLWGVAHGLLLVIHRQFKAFVATRPNLDTLLQTYPGTAARMALTVFIVALLWVPFAAPGMSEAWTMFQQMFTFQAVGLKSSPMPNRTLWYTVAFVAFCHWLAATGVWQRMATRMPAPALGFGYAVALNVCLILAPDNGTAFIYFTF